MIAALTIAVIAQWILLAFLCGVVVLLLRQVGMLHERLGPVGALTLPGGPKAGEMAPILNLVALDGRSISIGGAHAGRQATLLFFLSPTCPICKTLIPIVNSIADEEGHALRVVLASDGDEAEQQRMVTKHSLQRFPLVLSTQLGLTYEVAKLPHAVLIDGDGRISAKGLVNNREHLESLFEARRRGVASLQQYFHEAQHGDVVPLVIDKRTVA